MPMNEKCTKCCPLLQTAEVSYAVTMKLIDDQLQIMEKTPTKTSQHIIEVVTDSNTVPRTIENPPLIDVISTHYQLQQEYNSESSNSDASGISSAASSRSGSIESPDGSDSAGSSDTDGSDDQ